MFRFSSSKIVWSLNWWTSLSKKYKCIRFGSSKKNSDEEKVQNGEVEEIAKNGEVEEKVKNGEVEEKVQNGEVEEKVQKMEK